MSWARRFSKTLATSGRSEPSLTSFSTSEARMTVRATLSPGLAVRPSWAWTWRKRWTMAASIRAGGTWRGERGGVGGGEEIALERGCVGREVGDERGLAAFGGEKSAARAESGGFNRLGNVED